VIRKGGLATERFVRAGVCLTLLTATAAVASAAAIHRNFPKRSVYRVTHHDDVATTAEVRAMLGELDKLGPVGQEKLKQWLASNAKRFGIKTDLVRKTVILPAGEAGRETAILLLSNPDDEARARATPVKSSTSNSSE